jgi:hypothetical protein
VVVSGKETTSQILYVFYISLIGHISVIGGNNWLEIVSTQVQSTDSVFVKIKSWSNEVFFCPKSTQ